MKLWFVNFNIWDNSVGWLVRAESSADAYRQIDPECKLPFYCVTVREITPDGEPTILMFVTAIGQPTEENGVMIYREGQRG